MKLLLENFKKNMKENFRGPTDDPSFSDPGYNDPPDYDRLNDEAGEILGRAMENPGTKIEVDHSMHVTYDAEGDQFIVDTPKGQDIFNVEREEELLDVMIDTIRNSREEEERYGEF